MSTLSSESFANALVKCIKSVNIEWEFCTPTHAKNGRKFFFAKFYFLMKIFF